MRKAVVIGLLAIGMVVIAAPKVVEKDEFYEDDSYYWPSLIISDESTIQATPYYRHTREFIFVDDTTQEQHPDTVKMIIRNR